MRKIFLSFAMLALALAGEARDLKLASLFSDGMVLQCDRKVPVWGWGEPGEYVTVSFAGKTTCVKVHADGSWKAYLPKMKACSEGQRLVVSQSGKDITVNDVLVGDVFLCSGQSNMELPVRRCMDKVGEKVRRYSNNQIRYVKFPPQYNYVCENEDIHGVRWQSVDEASCMDMSAICYFMARELQENRNVPIGIVNSSVGGTSIESWMPKETLQRFDQYRDEFSKSKYVSANWVDSTRMAEQRRRRDWEVTMTRRDTVVNRWRTPGYSFLSWEETDMFNDWSRNRNGSYWIRLNVNVNVTSIAGDGVLRMGAMKDADSVFVNGVLVGTTPYEYPPRIYNVSKNLLRPGSNEVMVHLISESGKARFVPGKQYSLDIGGRTFPVSPKCRVSLGAQMDPKPMSTYFVDCPTGLYNAMIYPLRDMAVKGVVWYQGESNTNTRDYADYLCSMIKSWRNQLHNTVPVVVVQLPGFMSRHDKPLQSSGWCDIRESQRQAVKRTPLSALCSTIDTGEWNDIHPQDKDVAGHRVALHMLKLAYKDKHVTSDGPSPLSAKITKDGYVRVIFNDGQTKVIREPSSTWSVVDKHSGDLVSLPIVSRNGSSEYLLRYCYDDYPKPEIFGSTGLPTPQFTISVKK